MNSYNLPSKSKLGFSLIEMCVVIAVFAVLMSFVAPSFMALSHTKIAGDTAQHMKSLQNAAKWFYIESGSFDGASDPVSSGDPQPRWPGQHENPEASGCIAPTTGFSSLQELRQYDYLTAAFAITQNDWGGTYAMGILQEGTQSAAVDNSCNFIVTTNEVNPNVFGIFKSILPQVLCGPCDCSGTTPCIHLLADDSAADKPYVDCCSSVVIPPGKL